MAGGDEADAEGLAFFGGNLQDYQSQIKSVSDVTYFNLGSSTVKPTTMPRGSDPAHCKFVSEFQNWARMSCPRSCIKVY